MSASSSLPVTQFCVMMATQARMKESPHRGRVKNTSENDMKHLKIAADNTQKLHKIPLV